MLYIMLLWLFFVGVSRGGNDWKPHPLSMSPTVTLAPPSLFTGWFFKEFWSLLLSEIVIYQLQLMWELILVEVDAIKIQLP